MFVMKLGTSFLKVVMGNKLDTVIFTSISGSYSSDFPYWLYPSLIPEIDVKRPIRPYSDKA